MKRSHEQASDGSWIPSRYMNESKPKGPSRPIREQLRSSAVFKYFHLWRCQEADDAWVPTYLLPVPG